MTGSVCEEGAASPVYSVSVTTSNLNGFNPSKDQAQTALFKDPVLTAL
jgi:hypothetical protein